jgi:hypothetical protein
LPDIEIRPRANDPSSVARNPRHAGHIDPSFWAAEDARVAGQFWLLGTSRKTVMETSNLEKQVHAIETSMGKMGAQLRLVLLGLVAVIVIMACAGAFAFGSLFTEVQQQKHAIAEQQAAMEHPLNDAYPPGPQPQPGTDEDP